MQLNFLSQNAEIPNMRLQKQVLPIFNANT